MDITKEPDYDIRYFQEPDLIYLKSLLLQKEIMEWFPLSSETDTDLFLKNWVNFAQYKCALTAIYQGYPIGFGAIFLLPYRKVAIHTLAYVLVDPRFQHKKVGTSLVRNLIHLSQQYTVIERVQIECYEGCFIQPILENLGFVKMFRQEKFVKFEEPTVHYKARLVFERSNRIPV